MKQIPRCTNTCKLILYYKKASKEQVQGTCLHLLTSNINIVLVSQKFKKHFKLRIFIGNILGYVYEDNVHSRHDN